MVLGNSRKWAIARLDRDADLSEIDSLRSRALSKLSGCHGGGGGGQPKQTSQTVTQSTIPEWAIPDATRMLGQARALTDINQNPWQQYAGDRFANINPLQQQYMQGAANMNPSQQGQMGSNMATIAGLRSLNMGRFGQGDADQYMSPYIQNVLEAQKRNVYRDYARKTPESYAAASRAGGLGGTRNAILQAENQRNMQNQLQDIDAKGMQDAYANAQAQYNNDMGRQLQGYQTAMQGASTLGQLGEQDFGQRMRALQEQRQAGADLSAQEQQRLSAQYQDFIDQQNYPYKQMGFFSDVLHGLPSGSSTSTMYGGQPNNSGVMSNLAGGLASLYMGNKAGG